MAMSPGVGPMGKPAFARPRAVSSAPADRANPPKPKFFRKPRRLVAIGRFGSFASPDFAREISLGAVSLLDIINRPFRLPQLHDLVKSCDPLNTSGAKIFVSIPWPLPTIGAAPSSKLHLARAGPRTRSRAASETAPGQYRAASSVGRWRRVSWMDIKYFRVGCEHPSPGDDLRTAARASWRDRRSA